MIFFKILTTHEFAVAILIGILLGVIYAGASVNHIQTDSGATAIKSIETPAPTYVTVSETPQGSVVANGKPSANPTTVDVAVVAESAAATYDGTFSLPIFFGMFSVPIFFGMLLIAGGVLMAAGGIFCSV